MSDLTNAIDLIQESTAESELNVVYAINDLESKYETIMEHCNPDNIDGFMIQEGAIGDEMKKMKKDGESKIVTIAKSVPRLIIAIFRVLSAKLKKDETEAKAKEEQINEARITEIHNTVDQILEDQEGHDRTIGTVKKAGAAAGALFLAVSGGVLVVKKVKSNNANDTDLINKEFTPELKFKKKSREITINTNISHLKEYLDHVRKLINEASKANVDSLTGKISEIKTYLEGNPFPKCILYTDNGKEAESKMTLQELKKTLADIQGYNTDIVNILPTLASKYENVDASNGNIAEEKESIQNVILPNIQKISEWIISFRNTVYDMTLAVGSKIKRQDDAAADKEAKKAEKEAKKEAKNKASEDESSDEKKKNE